MLFNSFTYFIFLALIFCVYWLLLNNKTKAQNILLLAASLFFYGSWDWRFLGLIIFSSVVDFSAAYFIDKEDDKFKRKLWLWISLGMNLSLLGFFKYYNFFIAEFANLLSHFGLQANDWSLKIILPVGISFYTFQTMSYAIDVYQKKYKACKNFLDFFLYVCFFPQLVAGPIERADNIIPQIQKNRIFSAGQISDGLRQILWGLLKKIIIADNCSLIVKQIFELYDQNASINLLYGGFAFTLQIFADFSAYSDIAIGSGKLFGFQLIKNFNYPLYATNIQDFWRRWHISLTRWFHEYIYIALGGNRTAFWRWIINIFIVFIVSGLWHGANRTFIAFGLVHAIAFTIYILWTKYIKISLPSFIGFILTQLTVIVGFIFFRSENMEKALVYFKRIIHFNTAHPLNTYCSISIFILIIAFYLFEFFQRKKNYSIENIFPQSVVLRWLSYFFLILLIFYFYNTPHDFIYFQF